jgi:uncharacterized protein (DUF2235 family)
VLEIDPHSDHVDVKGERDAMSKVIVFCADGTWNGPGEPDADNTANPPTNVFKLFLNLAGVDQPGTMMLAKEQERVLTDTDGTTVLQWSKYLHGVGDSQNELVQLLGGSVGAGLIERIVRGYTFISRTYRDGDRIHIVGFSRGAYTARALAGLIANKGLLDATQIDLTDKTNAYMAGTAVWYDYRRTVAQSREGWFDRLDDLANLLPGFVSRPPVAASQMIMAPIESVAVWDTVGSLGIPLYTLQGSTLDVFQFADTVLSPVVKHGLHAVAADEQRADFTPTLWNADGRIVQALFPGCHSDVGGGFPLGVESGLSDAALQWMTEKLTALGVRFLGTPACPLDPDPRATAHQSWLSGIWSVLPKGPRQFPPPPALYVSEELVKREQPGDVVPDPSLPACPYAPSYLSTYIVAGDIMQGVTVV